MIRISLAVASLAVAFVAVSMATGEPGNPGDAADAEKTRRLLEQLSSPIPVEFDGVRLVRVETYFSSVIGSPVAFDWPSFERFGLDQETPVRLTMPNVPASTAMELAIYAAIAGADPKPPELARLRIVTTSTADGVTVSVSRMGESKAERMALLQDRRVYVEAKLKRLREGGAPDDNERVVLLEKELELLRQEREKVAGE